MAGKMAKDDRITLSTLGEYYRDLLEVDARINDKTISAQAANLLCVRLMQREQQIRDRVAYLARKRGLAYETMWDDLLTGDYTKLSPEEYKDLRDHLPDATDQ